MSEFQQKCSILAKERLAPDVFRLTLHAQEIAAHAQPGEFVMVRVSQGLDPLLRRPLSIHRVSPDGNISLLFKVLGKGTEMLSRRCVGDQLDLVGPLGNGFTLPDDQPVCLIGGGMGIAPLLFLAEHLHKTGRKTENDHVLLGARTKDELTPLDDEFAVIRARLSS
ncbi:MAG: hypothetical protein D3916_17830 [Candidatus Electrothrix sp. MAN1_4]|nr:hypothetical protein [Candidatus Electrothrix sp. MAN1_4]